MAQTVESLTAEIGRIVAGFELTTIVLNPSSRNTFSAWQPA
jgi:hypothetical protein